VHFADAHKAEDLAFRPNCRRREERSLCVPSQGLAGAALQRDEETRVPPNDPPVPANVRLACGARVSGLNTFERFVSRREIAITLGARTHADGVRFAIGAEGSVAIGEIAISTIAFCSPKKKSGSQSGTAALSARVLL
jgi:hypothetical protein